MDIVKELGNTTFSYLLSVLKVDLPLSKVTLIKSHVFPDMEGETMDLDHLYELAAADGKIYKTDLEKAKRTLDPERIQYAQDHPEDPQTEYVRTANGERYSWRRYTILPKGDKESEIYIVCTALSEEEQLSNYLHEDGENCCYKISFVDLNHDRDRLIDYDLREWNVVRHMRFVGYQEHLDYLCKQKIHPDDSKMVRNELSLEKLTAYFDSGEKTFEIFYRRKLGNEIRWVKCRIFKTVDYSAENRQLVIMIYDINDSVTQMQNRMTVQHFGELTGLKAEQNYYSTILETMQLLTEPYQDFFVINAHHNAYISCKKSTGDAVNLLPPAGKYDQEIKNIAERLFAGEEKERFLRFTALEHCEQLLENDPSMKAVFAEANGERVELTYTRYSKSKDDFPLIVGTVQKLPSTDERLHVRAFGSFEVYDHNGSPIHFKRSKAMEVLAYLIDRDGFEVSVVDMIQDVLGQNDIDLNARKYISSLVNHAIKTLDDLGYSNIVVKNHHTFRINKELVDCDYYHLLNGDILYMQKYEGEYMKQYSWAEETNSSIPSYF